MRRGSKDALVGSGMAGMSRVLPVGGGALRTESPKLDKMKVGALATLVLQNSALALVMRYTRALDQESTSMYIPTTAVVMAEILKILVAVGMQLKTDGSLQKLLQSVKEKTVGQPKEFLKMAVLALLYTMQNNLSYVATSHLDGPTYQIICQSKILITALLSVIILKRSLSQQHWLGLVVLTSGVGVVQVSASDQGSKGVSNSWIGFSSAIVLCLCSGLAGVFFELMLKGASTSLWLRNIQLGSHSLILGLLAVVLKDWHAVVERGFFSGYNPMVCLCICLHSLGGLAVALVVKYADNLAKCFATSVSISLSCFLSYAFFGTRMSFFFVFGTGLVLWATYLYNTATPPKIPSPSYDKLRKPATANIPDVEQVEDPHTA
ncbi:unnamed protein product [Discosporangium mesarthrocarpum]